MIVARGYRLMDTYVVEMSCVHGPGEVPSHFLGRVSRDAPQGDALQELRYLAEALEALAFSDEIERDRLALGRPC